MRHLKISSLPKSKEWIEYDCIMLHSCFQILKNFIEKDQGLTHCDYEHHKDYLDELKFLYDWWEIRKETYYSCELDDQIDQDMLIRLIKIRPGMWT